MNIEKDTILEWYYVDVKNGNSSAGPISKRDIDVFLRTNEFNSNTFVFKQGMSGWTKICEIDELNKRIMNDMKETIQRTNNFFHEQVSKKSRKERLKEIAENSEPEKRVSPIQVLKRSKDSVPTTKASKTSNDDDGIAALEKLAQLASKSKEIKKEVVVDEEEAPEIQKDEPKLTPEEHRKLERKRKKKERQKLKRKNKWYTPKINSNVYVQGLPNEVSHQEMVTFFSKAGVIRLDPSTGMERIKLYRNKETGELKGDGLVSYAKIESVQIAIDMLDEREIKPGIKLRISKAEFKQKGNKYKERTAIEIDDITKIRLKANQEKQFSWREDDIGEGLRIVIIRNMFTPEDVIKIPNYVFNLETELKRECEEKLGPVKRIKVYEFNPEGIVEVKFEQPKSAEECIKLMDKRFFNERELSCFYYDGKTNYRVTRETYESQNKRVDDFGKWLESEVKNTIQEVVDEGKEKQDVDVDAVTDEEA